MTRAFGLAPPGYRLPAGARPGRVRLQVTQLERSLEFYTTVLGFRVLDSRQDRADLGAASGGPLIELHARPGARPLTPGSRLGLYHFAVLLPDRPSLGRVLAHLLRLERRVASADHGVSEALYLSDPDGLGLELYADRPPSAWILDGAELLMGTDPLDLRGLAAAAGSEAWIGMPEGTTIGHVHLHVADLARAEAFYHRALGFDKTLWRYPGALFLSAGGYHHHLGTNVWARNAVRRSPDDAGLLEWEMVLPTGEEVEDARASVEKAGYSVTANDAGALLSDDWGTRLRLVGKS